MKRIIKTMWKRLTCKHDYWWFAEVTWSNSCGSLDHERKEVICKCKHCGKEIADDAKFCAGCGHAVEIINSQQRPAKEKKKKRN